MKSDMLTCLENLTSNPSITPAVDAILFYAAALVNMLKPSRECTVLCKSNKSEFRRNLCFVLIEILQKLSEFLHIWQKSGQTSKEQRRTSCQSSLRNKGKLVVAHNQNSHQRALIKFWSSWKTHRHSAVYRDLKQVGEETTLFTFENNRLSCDWRQVLFLILVAAWHYWGLCLWNFYAQTASAKLLYFTLNEKISI